MRILMIGDIVGNPGREAVRKIVPRLRERENIDAVIANGENAAGGSGLTPQIVQELFSSGVDVVTSGDHAFKKKEISDSINNNPRLLRPANYPEGVPGSGVTVVTVRNQKKIGVINVAGRVFMEALECPFRAAARAAERIREQTPVIAVDVHAEATSEKIALGWYLNGKVSVVAGTHTHVQTADERILPGDFSTAFITDLGMTGPVDSVIGRKTEQVLVRFLQHVPVRFDVAEENVQLQGAIVDVDEQSGRATAIVRVRECLGS
ncbi:MAG: TIGR00282 family metallophosphoesterase [Candidatus Omnitrophica bacterium]|nr:TIGR00282 family metallophosphoesterase [Candidatus Omnitrophota bacterium]